MNIFRAATWNQVQTTLKSMKAFFFQYSQNGSYSIRNYMVTDNININKSQNQCLAHIDQKILP